jgi:hypothetical protein
MQRLAHFRQVDLELYAKALRLAGLPNDPVPSRCDAPRSSRVKG